MTNSDAIETDRLRLRPWRDGDLRMLSTLAVHPDVIRYVGTGQPWSPERSAEVHARTLGHWTQHGFGWRVAETRDSGEVIGFIALNFAGEGTRGVATDAYEIGWWLAPSAWRRGYGTEGARAVRDEAFDRLGAPSILARIRPENVASRALAEAIGMALAFTTEARDNVEVVVYTLDRHGPSPGG